MCEPKSANAPDPVFSLIKRQIKFTLEFGKARLDNIEHLYV